MTEKSNSTETEPLPEKVEISFEWDEEHQEWAGYSKENLIQIIRECLEELELEIKWPYQLHITFGHNTPITVPDEWGSRSLTPIGYCSNNFDYETEAYHIEIVINNGYSVLQQQLKSRGNDRGKQSSLELQQPIDHIRWVIMEELSHAHWHCTTAPILKEIQQEEEQDARLASKHHPYAHSQRELAARKDCFRYLRKKALAEKRYPFATRVLIASIRQSLSGVVVIPKVSHMAEKVFLMDK